MRKMMRVTCGMLLMVMSGVSQAAELHLESRGGSGTQLRNGAKLATGRIICREAHTGFHVWMNERQVDGRAERYVVQSKDGRHELRVRTGGDGWSPVKGEGGKGVSRPGQEEQVFFDVMADGNQEIAPGEYRFSVGEPVWCHRNKAQKKNRRKRQKHNTA
ncbi:TPA: adhesin [Escherichia coli]|nr:adhesin [Escherichia coli]